MYWYMPSRELTYPTEREVRKIMFKYMPLKKGDILVPRRVFAYISVVLFMVKCIPVPWIHMSYLLLIGEKKAAFLKWPC